MDPQVQASFIPKKPLDTGVRRRGGIGILMLISILIFLASVAAAGGAFLYQQWLNGQIATKAAQLKKSESAYDPSAIQDLVRLDTRIQNAQALMSKHVAASALFSFLSNETLQNVSWNKFDYTINQDGSAKLELSGSADSFATVALQSDQFSAAKPLKDVVFSGIAVGQNGGISFNVSATVDAAVVNYANTLTSAGTLPNTGTPTTQGAAAGASNGGSVSSGTPLPPSGTPQTQ